MPGMTGMTGDDQTRDGMQSKSSIDTSASDRRTTGVVSNEIQQKTSTTGGFLLPVNSVSRFPGRETVLSVGAFTTHVYDT
jgi:ssDNA-binding replication factor A large subunit